MNSVVHALGRPLANFWLTWSSDSWRQLPSPVDSPAVHSSGANADRVLLMGSGIAVGYGVVSHELALGGQLARHLTGLTHRGVDIDIVARARMLLVEATQLYADADLARFDASLLVVGDLEAFQLMPSTTFREQLRALVTLLDRSEPDAFLLTVSIDSIGVPAPSSYMTTVARRAREFATIMLEECEGTRVRRITISPGIDGAATVGRDEYVQWAASIAPGMVGSLNAAACGRLSAKNPIVDEDGRLRALAELDVLDETGNPQFDEVVQMARNLFGTDIAALNFIGADRLWVTSFAGSHPGNMARSEAVCAITIQRPELLVIEDLSADPRFRDRSWVGGVGGPRFYAGYPIESPDGHRVGSLCLIDSKPRRFSDRDHSLLRQLALRLQGMVGNREPRR